jgi:hypothetical protein
MKEALYKRLAAEARRFLDGYRSLREVRFVKYRIARGERDGIIRERLLERVAKCASTC